jgi:micrococcal nuclease
LNESIKFNYRIIVNFLVFFFLISACEGPLKDISIILIPDQNDSSKADEYEPFASVNGVDCIPRLDNYEKATLIDVIDGDSIRVAIQGATFEVRYIGVNTPEYYSDQRPAAIEATRFNKKLLSSSEIYLFKDISETDKYDRLLRYVIADKKFINLEMVQSGHAQAKRYFPDISCQATFDQVRN